MAYHTNVGPPSGPLLSRAGCVAIGVFQAPRVHTPIGEALLSGHDPGGRALWRLTFGHIELPGLFVVIDREFRPAG
jgi:hypothetical protein